MYFGVQYYPEQWPEERHEQDVRLMAEAGVNTVRLGEFAWSAYEPEPAFAGSPRFDLMDRAVALLARYGIDVIMCTCSRTPPPWVYRKIPDMDNVDIDGARQRAGGRYGYCPSNEAFAAEALRIDRAVVEHFAGHPTIVGWQIDNEIGSQNDCYCETCLRAFRRFLAETYGSTEALNEAWGADFWSFRISSFDEVPMVRPRMPNPQLALAYRRFLSDLNCRFASSRARMIRELDPGKWITTNFQSGKTQHTDYNTMAEHLDFNGLNHYPARSPELILDYYRGDRGRMLVLEQFTRLEPVDSGPGWMRLWAWRAIAHGAAGINFFRWRVSRQGQEMHRDGILPQSGRTARRYEELKRMGQEIEAVGEILDSVRPRSEIALAYDYPTRWALESSQIPGIDLTDEAALFHKTLIEANVPVDALAPGKELSGYRLVIAPRLFLLDRATADNLITYVRNGGTLLLTAGTGVVDEHGRCFDVPRPGPLAGAAGLEVSDMAALEAPVGLNGRAGGLEAWEGEGRFLADEVHPGTAEVVAEFQTSWRWGLPAITVNGYGRGAVIYAATSLSESSMASLLPWLLQRAEVKPLPATPPDVRAHLQTGNGRAVLFLLNYGLQHQTIELEQEWEDLFTRERLAEVTVDPVDLRLLWRPDR